MGLEYLGVGIKSPTLVVGGKPALVGGKELIQQSIEDILDTPVGTRFFNPEYGSRLTKLLFEPNDDVLEDLIGVFVYEALTKWETRIALRGIDFKRGSDYLGVIITYTILNSNEVDSFVYPFYSKLKY